MRYISTEKVKEGMILGKTLFGSGGQVLLTANSLIKKEYLRRIQALGYAGVYVKDEFSEGIDIEEVLSPEVKMATIKNLKNIFIADSENNKVALQEGLVEMKVLVSDIVDDIINNKDVMVNVIDLKVYDDYTYYHSLNVAVLSVAIGLGIGLNRDTLNALGVSAVLHDIGKKFISKELLEKKGSLTQEEFEIVKEHSQLGYSYIRENFNLSSVSNVGILQHHERFNGTGYPLGKKEKDITAFARILAVVDVYDALSSKRPYHEAQLPHIALEFIENEAGILFDPDVTKVFSKKISPYPVGMEVELSNGMKGLVAKNFEGGASRPLIKSVNENGQFFYLDLKNDLLLKNVDIVKVAI